MTGADESCNSAGSYYSGGSGSGSAGVKHIPKVNHHRNRQITTQQQFDYHHQSPTDLCTPPTMVQSISNDTFSNSDKQRPNVPELSSEASAATTARCGSTTTESHVSNSIGCTSNNDACSRSRDRRRLAINITSNPGYQVCAILSI